MATVIKMVNKCQRNEKGLSSRGVPEGSVQTDANSLKLFRCHNMNECKIHRESRKISSLLSGNKTLRCHSTY